jgi:hypothetical protein
MSVLSKGLGDLIREKSGGKVSSKKIWGHIFMLLAGTAFIFDGLHWYEININAFNTMVIAGTALIGLRTLAKILTKSPATSGDEEK